MKAIKTSSKYTGVTFNKSNGKWKSQIVINKRNKCLGYFNTEIEASYEYENTLSKHLKGDLIIKYRICHSKYKGVTWDKNKEKWISRIYRDGKLNHLGVFINEIDASNAYKKEKEKK